MPVRVRGARGGGGVHCFCGDDIEEDDFLHLCGEIDAHFMRDATTSVVTTYEEFGIPELGHHGDAIGCHDGFGVEAMVVGLGGGGGFRGIAVAAEVGDDEGEIGG